ncbi:hypothetical protein HALLA_15150 [Halostagnicola larsenii XH-48]|uniref:C2H2-type domain-containing protein n=1 Tax=Halostagnicola larsenii XH-48 TaxID=797299 RepID=W0JMJ2_9EURY|nr:hypothetical protein [Halostagnicola larsenii]AHF99930.1 hypothetical protein HALLA_15150 [Halostagnicola larsenii XH-48]
MTPTNQTCPICQSAFEKETRLTVHLEVEHRKSELATYLVENRGGSAAPIAGPEDDEESRSNTHTAPRL